MWDSHVHILPPDRTRGLVRWIKKTFPGHPSREDITPDGILSDLYECGVEAVFNLVFPLRDEETEFLNIWSRDIGAEHENVIPFGSLHIETPRKEEVVERCLAAYRLAGIKLHPHVQGFEAFSPPFEPMYRKLSEFRRPLVVHTGFDEFYRRSTDHDYMRGVLERYPEMPVVLVHSLFPRFALAHALMAEHPQLYLDMTNVITAMRMYRESLPEDLADAPLDTGELSKNADHFFALLNDFSDRIMFGTDHPAGMGSPKQIYADFESFGFSEEIRADLLWRTARGFLEECYGE